MESYASIVQKLKNEQKDPEQTEPEQSSFFDEEIRVFASPNFSGPNNPKIEAMSDEESKAFDAMSAEELQEEKVKLLKEVNELLGKIAGIQDNEIHVFANPNFSGPNNPKIDAMSDEEFKAFDAMSFGEQLAYVSMPEEEQDAFLAMSEDDRALWRLNAFASLSDEEKYAFASLSDEEKHVFLAMSEDDRSLWLDARSDEEVSL